MIVSLLVYIVHAMYSVHSFCADCNTNQVWRDGGLVDESVPCKFPFVHEEVIYYTCTYNHSQHYGGNPWCAIETDLDLNILNPKVVGICNDQCHKIPPRCKYLAKYA